MKLLSKNDYDFVENLLKDYNKRELDIELLNTYLKAMKEIINFFNVSIYKEFIQLFYFKRHEYKNRYPDNRSMLRYLCSILYVQEPTLYIVRKEIVYKSAMVFYKYKLLK